jgi:signal transduction histidine kinase
MQRLGVRISDALGVHAWVTWGILGLLGAAMYAALESRGAESAVVVGVTGSAFVLTAARVWSSRPRPALGWTLVVVAVGVWFVCRVFWQAFIQSHEGAAPSLSSWRNVVFLAVYPSLGGALLHLLHRRDAGVAAFVDTAIVGFAILVVVWPTLLVDYLDPGVTTGVAVVQIAFALGDIAILALLLRVLVSPGERPPALWLLVLSGCCYLVSNALWQWSAQEGEYSPGSWADAGWLLFAVGIAAAALHPSMRALYSPSARLRRSHSSTPVLLLVAAILIEPVANAVDGFKDQSLEEVLVAAITAAAVGVLVVVRLALILRERKSLAARLEIQNQELLELDALKDDFIASVSHELRTPLTSIRGYLDLVREGEAGELTDDQERFLGIVDRNADRLLRVVGDLLFVAQVGAGKLDLALEDVELDKLVDHATDAARPHADSRELELVSEIEPLPTLRADRARLGQVLDNLVSNAIKFTPTGGRVVVRAFAEDGAVVLEVSDTGLGMSPDEQARLFERFYRTAAASEHAIQGTGLGLTIVKAIVDAHGGSITVQSATGAGTTFRILLPVTST